MLGFTSTRRLAWAATATAAATVSAGSARAAFSMSDLVSVVGTGSNEAGFVVDWNDGTRRQSLAWGYRWDGTATGEQMLDAIAAGTSTFYSLQSQAGEFTFGDVAFGFGFDHDGDGRFPLSPPLAFDARHVAFTTGPQVEDGGNGTPVRGPADAGDQWEEGFNASYWGYFNSTVPTLTGAAGDWDYASSGFDTRTLANGDWDGWAYQPDFNSSTTPAEPTAAPASAAASVPEPATAAAFLAATAGLAARRRRRA